MHTRPTPTGYQHHLEVRLRHAPASRHTPGNPGTSTTTNYGSAGGAETPMQAHQRWVNGI